MKKIIITTIILAVFLSGCLLDSDTPAIQTTEAAVQEITEKPITATTSTPTATVDLQSSATSAIVETPIIHDDLSVEFDLSVRSFSEAFIGSSEIQTLSKFDFGDGQKVNASPQMLTTEDGEGNIYFIRNVSIYKIDSKSGQISLYKDKRRIHSEYESDKLTDYSSYVGVIYLNNTLYSIIQTEPEAFVFNYYIVNVETGEYSNSYLNKPCGLYGTKILDLKGYNEAKNRFDSRFYDVIEDEFYDINIDTLKNDSRIIENVSFATEDYILLTNRDKTYNDPEGFPVSNNNLYFINSKTFELEAIYPLSRNAIGTFRIFKCEDGLLYLVDFYGDMLTIKPSTWEYNRVCAFEKQTLFAGYDSETDKIYLKQRYNYEHTFKNHSVISCVDILPKTAFDIIIEFDLEAGKYIVTDKVYIKDELSDEIECINDMRDYKLGEFILNYYDDSYEGIFEFDSFNFVYKLRNGGMLEIYD